MQNPYLLICLYCLGTFALDAQETIEFQNKQKIFTDTAIVWAAYFEIDVVPDLPQEQLRKRHARLPYLAEGYGQLSDTLKFLDSAVYPSKHQQLNGFILHQTESIAFYEAAQEGAAARSHKLKTRLHHWNLALEDPSIEPETFGEYQRLPDEAFEAFRLKGILYYDQHAHNFRAIPEAVAVLKSLEGDTEAAWSYEVLAWMPVSDLLQQRTWEDQRVTWAQYIERSIPLSALFVFKQDWTSDEVFLDQTHYLRQQAAQLQVWHPYPSNEADPWQAADPTDLKKNTLMSEAAIQNIATYEEMAVTEDEFGDFTIVRYPIDWSVFKGIRLAMHWAWFNHNRSLSVAMKNYLPFDNTPEEGKDFFVPQYFYRLPFGSLKH